MNEFGMRFVVCFSDLEVRKVQKYLESKDRNFITVTQEDVVTLINDPDAVDPVIIWYQGDMEDQAAIVKLTNGQELF